MKPVNELPSRYGEKKEKRFEEIQAFVASKCKIALVDRLSKNAKSDANGYNDVINEFEFGCNIKVHNIGGNIYLEREENKNV